MTDTPRENDSDVSGREKEDVLPGDEAATSPEAAPVLSDSAPEEKERPPDKGSTSSEAAPVVSDSAPEEKDPPPEERPSSPEAAPELLVEHETPAPTKIGKLETFALFLGLIGVAGVGYLYLQSARPTPVATTVKFYTFDHAVGPEWSEDKVAHARFKPITDTPSALPRPESKRFFLGPFGAETVDLDLTDLPSHEAVTVTLDLFLMDTWDGNAPGLGFDRFQIRCCDDPDPTFNASFTNSGPESPTTQSYPFQYGEMECPGTTGASEVGTLGFDARETPHNSVYRISNSFPHSDDTLTIRFSGVGLNDEHWGLDNVSITTSSQLEPNPQPSWADQCQNPD